MTHHGPTCEVQHRCGMACISRCFGQVKQLTSDLSASIGAKLWLVKKHDRTRLNLTMWSEPLHPCINPTVSSTTFRIHNRALFNFCFVSWLPSTGSNPRASMRARRQDSLQAKLCKPSKLHLELGLRSACFYAHVWLVFRVWRCPARGGKNRHYRPLASPGRAAHV